MKLEQLETCINAHLKAGQLPTWRSLGRMMGKDRHTIKKWFAGKFEIQIKESEKWKQ